MEVDQCKWNLNGTCSRVLEYLGCDCPVSKKPNLCTKYEPITMIYVNYDRLIEFFDDLKKTSSQYGIDLINQFEFYVNKLKEDS